MQPKKIKILLVEDDSFLASLYATKFTTEGFEVLQTGRGEEVLELSKQEKPEVILLDLVLPGTDGFSALAALKSEPATKKIPVVILTNLNEREEVNKGFALGAADYLVKSNFLPSEVVEKVRKVIRTV